MVAQRSRVQMGLGHQFFKGHLQKEALKVEILRDLGYNAPLKVIF